MAMIIEHDYVTILSFVCPYCHKKYGEPIRIGRYPFADKLHCNKGCGMEFHPTLAENVEYLSE